MRVGLDIRYLSHNLTGGIHTYVLNLARALPLASPRDEFVFYADEKAPLELESFPDNVAQRMLPWSSALSTVANDRRLAAWMYRDAVDVAHYPDNYGVRGRQPMVVTLQDTLNLFPWRAQLAGAADHPRRLATQIYAAVATRMAVRRADWLITPSEHARQDIAARTGVAVERIDVVPLAADAAFKPVTDRRRLEDLRARWDLPAHLIVADGIKNPAVVIDAYRALPEGLRAGSAIVFFARDPRPRPPVAAALGAHVRFIPRPTTDDLAALFTLADAFVFPSWYEGFGLPLVEAMQCGTPVVGSTRGSIPEVMDDAGLLFEVDDRPALTRHLAAILESQALRQTLRAKSLARAATFSWERTAKMTLDVYRRLVPRVP